MKVLQITDCHVSGPDGSTYRGTDPRAGLERVIEAAIAWGPDLILATGDLSEDGSEASYAWLAAAFAGGRHAARVAKITAYEDRHLKQE